MSQSLRATCVASLALGALAFGATPASAADATIVTANRAGYVVANGAAVHRVRATWIQPSATCGSSRAFANVQIGLTNRGQGMQVGTAVDCRAGHAVNYAWHSSNGHRVLVRLPVAPGDRMQASIENRDHRRGFILSNLTQGWGVGTGFVGGTNPPRYRAAFLVTARSNGEGTLPLTDFGRATFLGSRVNDRAINLLGADYVSMEAADGQVKAYPLPLQSPGRFAVLWQHR